MWWDEMRWVGVEGEEGDGKTIFFLIKFEFDKKKRKKHNYDIRKLTIGISDLASLYHRFY